MADLKTKQNDADVDKFLNSIDDPQKGADSKVVLKIMEEITGEPAKMWGTSIIGFGSYHYKYASGHEGDAAITGFSPRKASLTMYIVNGFNEYQDLLGRLGKHSTSVSCLYIKRLSDIDLNVLKELIKKSVAYMKRTYPPA